MKKYKAPSKAELPLHQEPPQWNPSVQPPPQPSQCEGPPCEGPPSESAKSTTKSPRAFIITCLILTLGAAASGAFVALGVTANRRDKLDEFRVVAAQYVQQLENDWTDYQTAGLWTHQATRRSKLESPMARKEFTELYENLLADGLEFQAISWLPNVTHDRRPAYEAEARSYYHNLSIDYAGFVEYPSRQPRTPQPFYFPITYVEPLQGNERLIGQDMYNSEIYSKTTTAINKALQRYEPVVSERLQLEPEKSFYYDNGNSNKTDEAHYYGVFLMHTGIPITALPDMTSHDLSLMEIRIPDLLKRTTKDFHAQLAVYLFDTSDSVQPSEQFLGGVKVEFQQKVGHIQYLKEVQLHYVDQGFAKSFYQDIKVADRTWTVVVLADRETFCPNNFFVILGGCLIFVGCTCLAMWEWTHKKRIQKYNELSAQAEAERQALVAESGYRQRERDLNDYMAHEVRNPVAAALSAIHFVKDAVHQEQPLSTEQQLTLREDVRVVDCSLHFVNDLLRSMIDIHKASSNRVSINKTAADLLKDVLEPVNSMLSSHHNTPVTVVVDCPDNLVVYTDTLKLRQIMTNLGRNSFKFVERGFIKLCATVVKNDSGDENVILFVEDSGFGVPLSKRNHLFEKFQTSLDSLNQGTGLGLHLSKELAERLGGRLYFDENYESGIEGCPGSRFVVDLQTSPVRPEKYMEEPSYDEEQGVGTEPTEQNLSATSSCVLSEEDRVTSLDESEPQLPSILSVLFVDDDYILRRLFSRSIQKALPGWTIREASNGETALKMTQEEEYDIIFMDQYMASVERQMLGTETVQALRNQGVRSRICGLSANNMKTHFREAGADAFMMKPFPCDPAALKKEMRRILFDCPSSVRKIENA